MSLPQYPLEEILKVKYRREEDALKALKEKQALLEREQQKLKEMEEARDKVKMHYDDKLQQLRDTLDGGTTTDKIQQMKYYLALVLENLEKEEEKVKKQQEEVDTAEKAVRVAEDFLAEKKKEVEKLELHREEWEKEAKRELAQQELKEQEEMGATMFLSRWQQNKPQN